VGRMSHGKAVAIVAASCLMQATAAMAGFTATPTLWQLTMLSATTLLAGGVAYLGVFSKNRVMRRGKRAAAKSSSQKPCETTLNLP
jgi:hypothetical protein